MNDRLVGRRLQFGRNEHHVTVQDVRVLPSSVDGTPRIICSLKWDDNGEITEGSLAPGTELWKALEREGPR